MSKEDEVELRREFFPCPYDCATMCCLEEPCLGCETFHKHLSGSKDKAPARNMKDIEDGK